MDIKPALVKELRERTGAGMMDCKKALVEAAGDIDAAAEHLRKAGQAKADKKSSRLAAEGRIVVASDNGNRHVLVEVNSETDFVANDENFRQFADSVADTVLKTAPGSVDALMATEAGGSTLEESQRLQPSRELDAGFVASAYRWARGHDLEDAIGDMELTGGDFVRTVKQIADLAGQLRDVGDTQLRAKATRTVDQLRRGIVEA